MAPFMAVQARKDLLLSSTVSNPSNPLSSTYTASLSPKICATNEMSKADSFPSLSYALALSDPDAFISELRSALSTAGFFNLVDLEGIEGFVPAWDEIFQATDEFFRLSDEEKLAIRIMESRHFRGYSAVGVEVTAGQRDLREQIDLGLVPSDSGGSSSGRHLLTDFAFPQPGNPSLHRLSPHVSLARFYSNRN